MEGVKEREIEEYKETHTETRKLPEDLLQKAQGKQTLQTETKLFGVDETNVSKIESDKFD